MSIELTSEETNKVASKQLPESKLPRYFNAQLGRLVPITRDFEAFLIVESKSQKTTIINWLTKVRDMNVRNDDRDALITKAITFELTDAQKRKDEIVKITGQFDTFRKAFQDSRFSSVPEVGQMLADMQKPMAELTMRRDRATHDVTMSKVLQRTVKGMSDNEKKQLNSWTDVLNAY